MQRIKKLTDIEEAYCDCLTFSTPPLTFQEILEVLLPYFEKSGCKVDKFVVEPQNMDIIPTISCILVEYSLPKLKGKSSVSVKYMLEHFIEENKLILSLTDDTFAEYISSKGGKRTLMEKTMSGVIVEMLSNFELQ